MIVIIINLDNYGDDEHGGGDGGCGGDDCEGGITKTE